jgi:hypothetical protein
MAPMDFVPVFEREPAGFINRAYARHIADVEAVPRNLGSEHSEHKRFVEGSAASDLTHRFQFGSNA